MITPSQAYVVGYAEVGSSVDGWDTTEISGDFSGDGGGPLDPIPAPTVWSISWFAEDGSALASVQVDAQTGAVS